MRAKNTSRQRAHLMECQPYLDAMKEHNPQSAILELASNPQPTPPKNPKKRDFDAVVSGFQGNDLGGMGRAVPKPKYVRSTHYRHLFYILLSCHVASARRHLRACISRLWVANAFRAASRATCRSSSS